MKTVNMKSGKLALSLIMLMIILCRAYPAYPQVKIGSNPGVLSSNAVFDAENTGGSHFVFLQNGYAGIGITIPVSTLHVNGIITANGIQGPSDVRFKNNITPLPNVLDKVMQIGGYTYDWKDASQFPDQGIGSGHDMGIIAQEVEKQFPEAVSTNPQGYKAVKYFQLIPVLVEAIKAQQVEILELKARLDKIK